tara:strand:- start:447 stop:710 length:264 start_codon:yes stop_codon:yes gene_type:complete
MYKCRNCGRNLTDPESVRIGVGPVCYTKTYGVVEKLTAEMDAEEAELKHDNHAIRELHKRYQNKVDAAVDLTKLGGGPVCCIVRGHG